MDAVEIVNKIYRSKQREKSTSCKKLVDYKSHTIHYGYIYDGDELLDEVMVAIMKAPNSFTMEDTVEIDCHGGVLVMNRILEAVIKNGARIAEPGEFTKRAFLNGRIDLSKAEAIIDIIHAKNEYALKSSVRQLKGSVSDAIKNLRDQIIFEIAFIESALDDPEHISLDGYPEKLFEKVDDMLAKVNRLLASSDNGKMLKEGINTVILGKPNAGKSSILNNILGEERVIVSPIAGTTRDAVDTYLEKNGQKFLLIDTAGLRRKSKIYETVEKYSVIRSMAAVDRADVVLIALDAHEGITEQDTKVAGIAHDEGKACVFVINKWDLIEKDNKILIKFMHLFHSQIDEKETKF